MVSWRSGTCLVHPAEQWEMHACPRGTSTGFSKNTPVRDRRPGPILSEGSAPRRNLLSRANPKYHGPFGHPPRVANSSSSPSQRHDACASPPGAPPGTGRSAPRGFPLRTPSASLLRSPPRHPRCETSRSEFPFLCPRSRGNRAQARGFLPPVARAPGCTSWSVISSPLFARVAGLCSSRQSTRFRFFPTFTRYFRRGPQGRGTSAFFSASGTCPSFDCVRSRFGPRCSGRPKAGGGSRPSIHCPREDGPCPGKVVRTKNKTKKNSLDSRRTWRTDAPLTSPTHPSSWSADGTDNASLVQALRDNEIVTSESVESAMRRESPGPLSLCLSLSLVSLYGLFLTRFVPLVPPFCPFS